MAPHKVNGTHVFFNNKTIHNAFKKRENNNNMKVNPSKFKPFHLVTRDDNKVIIVLGKTQASPIEFNNEEEAEKYLETETYDMVLNLIMISIYYEKNNENSESDK